MKIWTFSLAERTHDCGHAGQYLNPVVYTHFYKHNMVLLPKSLGNIFFLISIIFLTPTQNLSVLRTRRTWTGYFLVELIICKLNWFVDYGSWTSKKQWNCWVMLLMAWQAPCVRGVPACMENQPAYLQAQIGHAVKDSIWHPKRRVWLSEIMSQFWMKKTQMIRHFKEATKYKLYSTIIYI